MRKSRDKAMDELVLNIIEQSDGTFIGKYNIAFALFGQTTEILDEIEVRK